MTFEHLRGHVVRLSVIGTLAEPFASLAHSVLSSSHNIQMGVYVCVGRGGKLVLVVSFSWVYSMTVL